jgi:LmbE family N-acetylglucosaminyl deacetylase
MTDNRARDIEQAPPNAPEAPPTDESPAPRRVLVIQSHPDDAEFMCAGTVAKWVQEGAEAHYCSITSGDKGTADPGLSAPEIATIREREQRNACTVLGVKSVIFLGYPDVLMCQDPTMRFSGQRYINHPDHLAAGEAALAAVFPSARDHKTFPELLDEGLEPHITPEIYIYGAKEADIWVDISSAIDTKIAALKEHVSQVGGGDPTERMYEWGRETARLHPDRPVDFGEFAESFKYMNLGS